MSPHIKRLAAPDFWPILKKKNKWAVSPSPGPHAIEYSIPLAVILREILGYASNLKEVKIILSKKYVKRDGKTITDYKFPLGFMDTLELAKDQFAYRLLPYKGKPLVCAKIPKEEASLKICKVIGKRTINGGKIQLNLHDGRNTIFDAQDKDKVHINDSLLITLPDQEIKDVLKFQEGNFCLIYRGVNAGSYGILRKINLVVPKKNSIIEIEDDKGNVVRTNINYAIPIGYEKPLIKLIQNDEDYVIPAIYKKIYMRGYHGE
ncbi:MAG TPA: 30S ribosomal protein S4e [Geobacterales bacterium]|nr:30S ribosomal protein S4e [Geobacterales bacterium]